MKTVSQNSDVVSAATMISYVVRNTGNEILGCVEEMMVHPGSGRILYAVLSLGGYPGVGGRLVAVPYKLLKLDSRRRAFVLAAGREVLENAPVFDEENWPDFCDPDWTNQINSHYGLRPRWRAA